MRHRLVLATLLVASAVAGCTAGPGADVDAPKTLTVGSPTIPHGGPVPDVHTCDGPNRSPQIDVTNLPQGTVTVALIVDDPDATRGTFVHWVVYDAPASGGAVSFPEGSPPQGAVEGVNGADRPGYTGPCPPVGSGEHRYRFKAYAVDRELGIEAGASKAELVDALQGRALAWGELVGTYQRN